MDALAAKFLQILTENKTTPCLYGYFYRSFYAKGRLKAPPQHAGRHGVNLS
ncbi:hypothetical protein HMPREF9120_02460 [Neisseria sp. oral taxon 020 str. F0370]|nr:hypothetical protein HMPREF9120_02460 [Neisseria sp. oral taxon 020 str. F0370]